MSIKRMNNAHAEEVTCDRVRTANPTRSLFVKLCMLFACAFILYQSASVSAADPVKLIFDTDMGNDIDDALALGVIHALQSRGECELLAVTVSKDNPNAARYCDLVNTFYGRGEIPIGRVRNGKTPKPGNFVQATVEQKSKDGKPLFSHDLKGEDDTPDAHLLLRKVLAAQPDHSVVIVVVGFSTNLARLLETPGDEHSKLNGTALVKQKVKLLSMMAGHFGNPRPEGFKEYNAITDLPATRQVLDQWPTPIVISGFEIGLAIRYPFVSIQQDYNYRPHPLQSGYLFWSKNKPHDRPTWDLTSVLYAVRPDRDYFGLSETGMLSVGKQDWAIFSPKEAGQHRYLKVTPEQIVRVREALVMLASQPPDAK